jgi:hypothetical protein
MAVVLTGILSDLSSVIPSSSDILQQLIIGAGTGVLLSGLKTQAGMDAIDPLHIIHKDQQGVVQGTTVTGKTIPQSLWAQMTADQQKQLAGQGYVTVAG